MARLKDPKSGYCPPTEEGVEAHFEGDDRFEAEIQALADQLSLKKRERHDHRNRIIETHKIFTPSAEDAKKFARKHTPYLCALDLMTRAVAYKALGVFDQADFDVVNKTREVLLTVV